MIVADAVDWTQVLVAVIVGLPAIISAGFAARSSRSASAVQEAIKTPSDRPIGRQVEAALHSTIANNYRLQVLGGRAASEFEQEAEVLEAQTERITNGEHGPSAGAVK